MRVQVTADPPEGWDRFVESDPRGSFCHLSGWGRVFADALGVRPRFLAALDGETIRGVLPLYRMGRLGPGHVLVSVPYLNYGGPIGDAEAVAALEAEALREAEDTGARRLELRSRGWAGSGLDPSREKVTVLLDLPSDPDELFTKGFKAKLRSQIRRPMKEGMEVRFGPSEVDAFYGVFARNMRDLGTPVLPGRCSGGSPTASRASPNSGRCTSTTFPWPPAAASASEESSR